MNVVIASGGTGGHMFPAIVLAEEFYRQDPMASVTLVGTGRHLERTMLQESEIQLETLYVRGIVGRSLRDSLIGLMLIPGAIWRAMRLLRARCADVVIGTGGYTSPPVVIAAFFLGIRRALLEPNAVPGLANRIMGPLADRIFLSFEAAKQFFNPSKVRTVGVPIRKAFLQQEPSPSPDRVRTVLICGGSQGARAINSAVIEALEISKVVREDLNLIHQTGADDVDRITMAYAAVGVHAQVVSFISDMPATLRSADLVVSRCGALTLAELSACGKAAILIPFPHAAHNHQEKNARVMEQAGAAVVIPQAELTAKRLVAELEALFKSPDHVKIMAQRSRSLRRTDSAEIMVRECLALAGHPASR